MHTTYIIYSKLIDGYYVGSTSGPTGGRLKKHNAKHKGYTSRANDWEVIYEKHFSTIIEARVFELIIKKRGASRYLNDILE